MPLIAAIAKTYTVKIHCSCMSCYINCWDVP